MTHKHDLELNAYIDGEMSAVQIAEFNQMLKQDAGLKARLDQLIRLKSALSECFPVPPSIPESEKPAHGQWCWLAVAGFLLLVSGFLIGAMVGVPAEERFVLIGNGDRFDKPVPGHNQDTRIVFHLTNPDQVVAGDLLSEVEQMLASYRNQSNPLRIEIVSHGEGLGLLRERLSRHRERIALLAENYENLVFVACQNTIDRLRVEKGVEVTLLPEATIIDSGVSHVVKRQMEGWSYIRV